MRIAANFLKSASDCHTSTTRQPFGVGPATWDRTPGTGQSDSAFNVRPFVSLLSTASYCACVTPGNSNRTPMAICCLQRLDWNEDAKLAHVPEKWIPVFQKG